MQLLRLEQENGRVIFTGAVDHERVPALLDACDVLVAPHVPLADGSAFFGSPTKLFEYMAMGKGIVASRLGQIGDVLNHEETALLVEPGDAGALKEAIVRLVESPELREHLGKEAREIAVRSYTWKHNAQRVLDAYRSWAENNE
jgi:glycosyltransferase involved in cell wall biosynthesis